MNMYTAFTIPGVLYLAMMLFGIWLANAGKPYNSGIFTIHKILALAFVVLTIVKLIPSLKETGISGLLLLLIILSGLSIIGLFASGAAMSIIENSNMVLLWLHRILPFVVLGSVIGMLEILKTTAK